MRKVIISESRLHEFLTAYLDSFVDTHEVVYHDPYIVISDKDHGDDVKWVDHMEYDHTDGRLWVNRDTLDSIYNSFPFFRDKESFKQFLVKWFENRFEVEVKFIKS